MTASSHSSVLSIHPVLTKQSLIEKVEFLVVKDKMRYAEALVHLCHEHQIDPEDVVKLITPALKTKIAVEARARNVIPKTGDTFSLDSF
jgi:hypothetical protein